MDRTRKGEVVAELKAVFSSTEIVVVATQSGLTVAESTSLRRQARAAGAGYKVTKNRLARLALEGTRFARMADMFKGPTAIAYSTDPVAAAKIAVAFAKTNPKLVVIGGGMADNLLAPAQVEALTTLPSLDELRARLVGMIQTPATRIAGVLAAPAGQLARVTRAFADKDAAAA
ncbi:MAG: 50S ribosomal protein L10 [Alphaproteobacteria bacterium]|nr:50S ribosomal protein L10 [Alphaproteobacteria bacterium]